MLSSRQDYYTMTAWGPVAVWLAGLWLNRRMPKGLLLWPLLIVAVVSIGAAGWAIWVADHVFAGPAEAQPFTARGGLCDTVRSFSLGVWRDFRPLVIVFGLGMAIGSGVASVLVHCNRRASAALVLAGTMTVPFALAVRGLTLISPYFSLAPIAEVVKGSAGRDALIVCDGEPRTYSSLFFYLPRPLFWVGARRDNEFAVRHSGIGFDRFLQNEQFCEAWQSQREVFFVVEEASLGRWGRMLGQDLTAQAPLGRSGTRLLFENSMARSSRLLHSHSGSLSSQAP
jgi:hypothetical protein